MIRSWKWKEALWLINHVHSKTYFEDSICVVDGIKYEQIWFQGSILGTRKDCHVWETPIPPTLAVVMEMTTTMNIWGKLLMGCKWRGHSHLQMMTECIIHTCACTHTVITQRPDTESRMTQTEAMAVSPSLTNLSHWLSRGISSFNNRERKRQRYQKGIKHA